MCEPQLPSLIGTWATVGYAIAITYRPMLEKMRDAYPICLNPTNVFYL